METTLLPAGIWAQTEFFPTALGDFRRSKRLVQIAAALADTPNAVLYRSMTKAAELKAAYRLFENENVSAEQIRAPHLARTRERCRQAGEYLMIEDTTTLNYSGLLATEGLGRIGADRNIGLFLHTTLALKIEKWNESHPDVTAVGLLAQKSWARTMPTIGDGKERSRERWKRERESQRWAADFEINGGPPPGTRWTLVSDREGDIYDVFEKCRASEVDWIIRACQPRALIGDESIFEAVGNADVLGVYRLKLRPRPGEKGRVAQLEVRATSVELRGPKRPGGKLEPIKMYVVEAREIAPPPGTEPTHWVLLTSWETKDLREALRVIQAYTRRWGIEEYHKALKTGTNVEETQLMMAGSIESLIAILGIVALRLLDTKFLASARPDELINPEAFCPEALTILEKTYAKPRGGWSNLTILVAIARLGGFLARKGDGNPGWICIWRGWHRLMIMVQGYNLAHGGGQKCG